ncbi:MAG: hypothetical protein GF364_15705 [Candidatus Lokiarchaeota archaeon]|nr:hypothetical protein [Candidatus Lokiarchaeota archaeon]
MECSNKFKCLTILFGALAGGAYWCTVRPSGYGCGPSLGLMWGLYWMLLVWYKDENTEFPSQALYILLVFVIGFGIGGTQGYGQFNQWMRGKFYFDTASELYTNISPIYGFYHLFICGLTWGGIPALLISWLLNSNNTFKIWIQRLLVAAGGFLLFQLLIYAFPNMFLPLYSEGYYSNFAICPDCSRTIDTAKTTYGYLGIFLFLAIQTCIKNKRSYKIILPIALGFALTFSVGGILHRGEYIAVCASLPWWKMWEFTCGFGGGLSVFFTFWMLEKDGMLDEFTKRSRKGHPKDYWWGFWIPLYLCIGELLRDRLHQIAKLYNIMYELDFRSEMFYVEMMAIVLTSVIFIKKLLLWTKWVKCNGDISKKDELLTIKHPRRLFLIIYGGFFWLMQFRWIVVPLILENNLIAIITILAYFISIVLFYNFSVKQSAHSAFE